MDLVDVLLLLHLRQSNWLELGLICQLLLFERLLEPKGGNDFDVFELESLADRFGSAFAPHQMSHVSAKSATNLASVIEHRVVEKSVRGVAICEDVEVERLSLEKLKIILN